MGAYILRRILYAVPILAGINIITFLLFFTVNSPDDMARAQLGGKRVTPQMIAAWKAEHGYDKPLFYNEKEKGVRHLTETLFFDESVKLFRFDFGKSDAGRDIAHEIRERMWPSLAIAVPTFLIALASNIVLALIAVLFRQTRVEKAMMIATVAMMSVSALFYIIFAQVIFAKMWHWVPISGYAEGAQGFKFVVLPVLVGVVSGMGAGIRWYRSIFLEQINQEYVRTARAKGLSERTVLFRHVLQNGMLPILTGVVVVIPTLFMGSLILESFFGIPGLGSYTIDAIRAQDFGIVKAMVFLGSVLYIVGLIATDISYAIFDPRVRL